MSRRKRVAEQLELLEPLEPWRDARLPHAEAARLWVKWLEAARRAGWT